MFKNQTHINVSFGQVVPVSLLLSNAKVVEVLVKGVFDGPLSGQEDILLPLPVSDLLLPFVQQLVGADRFVQILKIKRLVIMVVFKLNLF